MLMVSILGETAAKTEKTALLNVIGQTDRQADRQTHRHRHILRKAGRQTDRQTDTDRPRDRQKGIDYCVSSLQVCWEP